jgi:hypothetical protein
MRDPIERFDVKVRYGAITGRLEIDDFIDEYKAMSPSLHRHCNDGDVVDVGALIYCTERLPKQIYHIHEVLVQSDIPDKLPGMAGITELRTDARRRTSFDIGDDTIIVVAREGVTELLDLVTLLVYFVIEAKKIARLLNDDPLLSELGDPDLATDPVRRNRCLARLAFVLGVTDDEVVDLDGHWDNELLKRLLHLWKNPPKIVVRLHRGYSLEAVRSRSEAWAQRINQRVTDLVEAHGPLHVLSSNLHSCVNLLSGFAQLHAEEIWDFAESRTGFDEWDKVRPSRDNALYLYMRDWLKAHPDRQADKLEFEESRGVRNLLDVHHVGIDVQLVDCSKLVPSEWDPRLRLLAQRLKDERPLLINFDYAFGDQAGIVLDYLFRQFGRQIASFTVMGKAGTVVGGRGGVMLPTYLLRQGSDDVYDFPVPNFLTQDDFDGLQLGAIHTDGPMLTVLGTVLQNDKMLRRYRDEWGILGLEMEGIPYVRSLHQNRKRGYLSDNFKMGVAYYASDAPLIPGESLSRDLAFEGLDATYGISLAILNALLGAGPAQ